MISKIQISETAAQEKFNNTVAVIRKHYSNAIEKIDEMMELASNNMEFSITVRPKDLPEIDFKTDGVKLKKYYIALGFNAGIRIDRTTYSDDAPFLRISWCPIWYNYTLSV